MGRRKGSKVIKKKPTFEEVYNKSNLKNISDMNSIALENGMSYGQYVGLMYMQREREERKAGRQPAGVK